MMAFHRNQGRALTMAVTHQPDVGRYGRVRLDGGRVSGFEEKGRSGPGWINAGAYVLDREMGWPAGLGERFSFELDYLVPEIGSLRPCAFEVDGFFLDIGVPEDLQRAETALARF